MATTLAVALHPQVLAVAQGETTAEGEVEEDAMAAAAVVAVAAAADKP